MTKQQPFDYATANSEATIASGSASNNCITYSKSSNNSTTITTNAIITATATTTITITITTTTTIFKGGTINKYITCSTSTGITPTRRRNFAKGDTWAIVTLVMNENDEDWDKEDNALNNLYFGRGPTFTLTDTDIFREYDRRRIEMEQDEPGVVWGHALFRRSTDNWHLPVGDWTNPVDEEFPSWWQRRHVVNRIKYIKFIRPLPFNLITSN
ncbi:hypothetical protein G6F42_013858 [Rhizopus arrhizus]|nr:hypothetical protein G6F42_013858 [Rhizopus arrhizus]